MQPKQLRHYHSPDYLSWDECQMSDRQVERIDLEVGRQVYSGARDASLNNAGGRSYQGDVLSPSLP